MDVLTVVALAAQLFAIMDPPGALPALLNALEGLGEREARSVINKAALAILLLLTVFTVGGGFILHWLGIDVATLKVAAGVILMATALDTLIAGHRPEKIDVGTYVLVPIATPLIVGPGTITLLITSSRLYGIISTLIAAYVAFAATYLVLAMSRRIIRLLGRTFVHGLGRFMSLIIASFAVKMFVEGVKELFM